MPDRKKVLQGLECCTDSTPTEDCRKCPYQGEEYCTDTVMLDALALLRDPVKPKPTGIEPHYWCGNCEFPILYGETYCSWCGRAVKWNG